MKRHGIHRFLEAYNQSIENHIIDLKELETYLDSSNIDSFVGFLKSCVTMKKLTINDKLTATDMQKFLPFMSQLEDIAIGCPSDAASNEFFETIAECCPNLRKFRVERQYLEEARDYFRHTNLIIEPKHELNIQYMRL
jgi:hypothetical protein